MKVAERKRTNKMESALRTLSTRLVRGLILLKESPLICA